MTARSFLPPALRCLLPVSLALALAACASEHPRHAAYSRVPARTSVKSQPGERQPVAKLPSVVNPAAGSRLENVFVKSDTDRLSVALRTALVSPDPEKKVRWDNPATGAAGRIDVHKAYLTDVENVRGGRLWAPTGLDTSHVLQPAQGEYTVARAGVHVRLGPSLKGYLVAKLGQGMVVDALGREAKNNWLLVARRGVVLGYMYAPLLKSRDGDDLMLAGASPRRPILCRDFEQTVTMPNGVKDKWENSACRAHDGEWHVVDDVLGFSG